MKPITLKNLIKLVNSNSKINKDSLVLSVNCGFTSFINHKEVYFYSNQVSLKRQISDIVKGRPIAVVVPYSFDRSQIPSDIEIIRVKSVYTAFWKVARWNWQHFKPKVIGITGSAGKSTTTSMIKSIYMKKYPIITTAGNLNTVYYLPNYLNYLSEKHKILLLEMGMDSRGDIAAQCKMVNPTLGAITNVGEAHLGNLGSLDQIVKAKEELLAGLAPGGILYLNNDDAGTKKLNKARCKGTIKTFGVKTPSDIMAKNISYTNQGMKFEAIVDKKIYQMKIPTFGEHNVYNALAAIGIALSSGFNMKEIQAGLASFSPPKMRLQIINSKSGRVLINDAWNANPTAMKEGLRVLDNILSERKKIAVLGDMLELGHLTVEGHKEIGRKVAKMNIDKLYTLGNNAKIIANTAIKEGMNKSNVQSFKTHEGLLLALAKLPKNVTVYFKASRKMGLDKVIRKLT